EAGDQAVPHRITAGRENDRDGRSRSLRGQSGNRVGDDDSCIQADQIGQKRRQSFIPAFGPALLDGDIAPIDKPLLAQPSAKGSHDVLERRRWRVAKQADDRHCRLLGARCKRPRSRAAESQDERAALHSITSSARASSVGGTSRPSALAVFKLITSSYLVGACTGRSAGFSPLRIRST